MRRIVGIDLGTTFSCVAVMRDGEPLVIPNPLGSRLTPSVVHILDSGDAIVGEHAVRQRFVYPQSTITGIKRLIGRRYNEVWDIARMLSYAVTVDGNNLAVVTIDDRTYPPQLISALILLALRTSAESYLGEPVTRAVITVPAYFNDIQRQATVEAARIAGLDVMRIVNEPTAASLAYGLDKMKDETIAVFDLGGGTFDISILVIGQGVDEVRAVAGDGFLGGDDFDERIAEWIVEEFFAAHGIDLDADISARTRVRDAAVQAKHDISAREETDILVPFVAWHDGVHLDLHLTLTRQIFRELCAELFERLAGPCRQAIADALGHAGKVDQVILVGGATRMPGVAEVVRDVFGCEPSRSMNPDEAVAIGAAVQAGVLEGSVKNMLLMDVVPGSLGIETDAGQMVSLIPRQTTIPTRKSESFTTLTADQTSADIHVLQGESLLAENNRSLGRLTLRGLSPGPTGLPDVEVTFDIDANGIVNVTALDRVTGNTAKLTVLADTGLAHESMTELSRHIPSVRFA